MFTLNLWEKKEQLISIAYCFDILLNVYCSPVLKSTIVLLLETAESMYGSCCQSQMQSRCWGYMERKTRI